MTVVAVGFGSSEDLSRLGAYQDDNAMPFVFAEGPNDMLRRFGITSQSTKLGIAADGLIRFKSGYGTSSPEAWLEKLHALADPA